MKKQFFSFLPKGLVFAALASGIMSGLLDSPMINEVLADAKSDSKERLLDLGEISIEGEVRRPSLISIDSQKSVREFLPNMVKSEYEMFIDEIVAPAKPETVRKD